eukprot:TRINITY_DN74776_c0_g1_i1.p1 TRINITY_DN74776_c0_g1~~TRINITY_DN74776_c0_g1_i1.p1  ORF type:complete len:696 (-),score=67.73 TRINITY_DN74776_c0_g1_i1:88-2175(-)
MERPLVDYRSVEIETGMERDRYIVDFVDQMRRELAGAGGTVGATIELGSGVRVNTLLLALSSPLLEDPYYLDNLRSMTERLSMQALEALRDLLHNGEVEFTDRDLFFTVFRSTDFDMLAWPECYAACLEAARFSEKVVCVEMSLSQKLKLAKRLYQFEINDVSAAFPASLFDTSFASVRSPTTAVTSMPGSEVSSTTYRAHRLALVTVSRYFEARSWQELGEQWTINLDDLDHRVLKAFLNLAYVGRTQIAETCFKDFTFQIDAWDCVDLFDGCFTAMFNDRRLARQFIAERVRLPDRILLAVVASLPFDEVMPPGDTDAFIMCISVPAIACQLSWWCVVDDPATKDKMPFPLRGLPSGISERLTQRRLCQRFERPRSECAGIADRLEEYIVSQAFREFLRRPEAMRLPAWSVAMVVESTTSLLPSRFEYPRLPVRYQESWWNSVEPLLVDWLSAWVVSQGSCSAIDLLNYLSECPSSLQHLVHLRCMVRHNGGYVRPFFESLSRRIMEQNEQAAADTICKVDLHLQAGRRLEDMKRQGMSSLERSRRENLVRRWRAVDHCFGAAFDVAVQQMSAAEERPLPWAQLTCYAMLIILTSKELCVDARRGLQMWLVAGMARDVALLGYISDVGRLLRYPIKTNTSPRQVFNTIDSADVPERLAVLLGLTSEPGSFSIDLVLALQELTASESVPASMHS